MSSLTTLLEKLRALDEKAQFKSMPLRVHSIENAKTILTAIPLLLEIIEKQQKALEFYGDRKKWHQFIVEGNSIGNALNGDFCMAFDDGEDRPWAEANSAVEECDEIAARIK